MNISRRVAAMMLGLALVDVAVIATAPLVSVVRRARRRAGLAGADGCGRPLRSARWQLSSRAVTVTESDRPKGFFNCKVDADRRICTYCRMRHRTLYKPQINYSVRDASWAGWIRAARLTVRHDDHGIQTP